MELSPQEPSSPTVVITAAGHGSRMGELADTLPKCLLPLMASAEVTTALERILYEVSTFARTVVVVHGGHDWIRQTCGTWNAVSAEAPASGEMVAIEAGIRAVGKGGGVLVVSSDNVLPYGEIERFWQGAETGGEVVVGAAPVDDLSTFCQLLVSGNLISELVEKPQDGGLGLAKAGLYFLPENLVDTIIQSPLPIDEKGEASTTAALQRHLENHDLVAARLTDFCDVGTPQGYRQAVNADWLRSDQRLVERIRGNSSSGNVLAPEMMMLVSADPTATAEAWSDLDPRRVSWTGVLHSSLQNQVEALVTAAIRELGWESALPPSVVNTLDRRASLGEARVDALRRTWAEFGATNPELAGATVMLKGAVVQNLYELASHRMMSDFDLLIPEELLVGYSEALLDIGFWEKPGKNGPTFFRPIESVFPGLNHVCFDLHLVSPMKYNRESVTEGHDHWLVNTTSHMVAGVQSLRPHWGLLLVNLLVHAHEHAASWVHLALEDDVRVSRFIDIELVTAAMSEEELASFEGFAADLDVSAEVKLGQALAQACRSGSSELARLGVLDDDVTLLHANMIAMPTGDIVQAPVSLRHRALQLNRAAIASTPFADGWTGSTREKWWSMSTGLTKGSEPVHEVAARYRAAIR